MMGGGFAMVVFWVLVIMLVVLAVRWFSASGPRRDDAMPADKTPLQILQERYARGEIEKDEYEERRRTLGG
jgi:putative membrane protein